MNDLPKTSELAASAHLWEDHEEEWTPTPDQLKHILAEHEAWLQSNGTEGRQANLRKTKLWEPQLQGAHLREAQLQEAKLWDAQLQGANLMSARLEGADLREAQLQGAILIAAVLAEADLSGAQLQGADLSQAMLPCADLSGAQLQGANLAVTFLQWADFTDAQLQGAVLFGALLQEACLNRVNMEGEQTETGRFLTPEGAEVVETHGHGPAVLARCNLRGASLEDARLSTVSGLQSGELGGANLSRANLPKEIAQFKALGTVADISARARALFLSGIAACLYSWLTIATTTDVALIKNTGSTPLPIIQTQVPIAWFFWVAPGILLALFLYLHLYLQRLWEALASLPAVFPSGRTLYEEAYPWLLSSLVLKFVPMLRDYRRTLWWLQVALSVLAAWLLVPATILGYWVRYLPRDDWIGAVVISLLFVLGVAGAIAFWRRAAVTLRDGDANRASDNLLPETVGALLAFWILNAVHVGLFHG